VRWGPIVGVLPGGPAPAPPAVVVEVGGSAHLFGGEAALAARVEAALARGGWTARAAIAGTLGAAYALAGWSAAEAAPVVAAGEELAAIGGLPVAALRLEPDVVGRLARLAVRRVEDLAALPAASLVRRFGGAA